MAKHSSATAREETPHTLQTSRTNTIINTVKQRARAVLNDPSLDARSRAIIRDALEENDPWLAKLVRRAEAGETVGELDFSPSSEADEDGPGQEKIEALAEIICGAGDQSAGALLVLMGTFENSSHPKALAHTLKHFAFTRCGELNLYDMVDTQMAAVESELLSTNTPAT